MISSGANYWSVAQLGRAVGVKPDWSMVRIHPLRPKLSIMSNKTISVTLTDKQQRMFDRWQAHIKALHGEYGLFTWSITNNGIGSEIEVFSHLAKVKLALTDVSSW